MSILDFLSRLFHDEFQGKKDDEKKLAVVPRVLMQTFGFYAVILFPLSLFLLSFPLQ